MKTVKHATFWIFGVLFICLGIVGLVLPFLQGWLFIALGLILISLESPSLDNFLQTIVQKNKTSNHYYTKFRLWTRKKLGYE